MTRITKHKPKITEYGSAYTQSILFGDLTSVKPVMAVRFYNMFAA
jgi:hypothetical protein